jgi:hypothetical protein
MASTTISTAFVKQYSSTLDMLLELKGGQFEGKTLTDSITGEEKYYDQLGSVFASEVIDRYGDSPEADINHERRRVIATPYDVGLMLDRFDKVQMLIDPESEYVQRMASALNRKKTIECLKGLLGTAYSGKGGGTANELDFTYAVGSAVGSTGATGMNVAKLRSARQLLLEANVDLDDPMNKAYVAMGPQEQMELLASEEVTSADYNTIRALVNGEVNTFMGFDFIFSNQIPYLNTAGTAYNLDFNASDEPVDTDTTDVVGCFAWVKSAVRMVTNPDLSTDVERRGDKRFNWYAYSCLRTGAVRMEDRKVVPIACDRSPA